MKQQQFEAQNQALWDDIAAILAGGGERTTLPPRYRRLCQCLALARQRGYSPALTDYLQQMVSDCHALLYGAALARPNTLVQWMLVDFPQQVRAEWRLLLAVSVVFFGVAARAGLLLWFEPSLAYSFSTAKELAQYREMYSDGAITLGREGSEGDFQMFGHYIWNNVSIDFRAFAFGLIGAVPALLVVAYNGMLIGVVGSWLSQDASTIHNFWSFVITHASLEITGMLLAAMAGMRLGLALIRPGRLTRTLSLQQASRNIFPVLVGASIMTFGAAFIEAFWSASTAIPHSVKYAVGAVCWSAVIAFFVFAGRSRQ